MKLKSFGCSFIFGTDLSDDSRDQPRPTPSQLTWPAHLAKYLNRTYECYARPGAGNLQILEQILNQIPESGSSDIFVIGWTWIDRFDYYDAHWNPKKTLSPWKTIMPIDTDSVATMYYRDLHSEYRDKFVSLTSIKTAIDFLKQKNIKFIMTYMDRLLFDQRWNTSAAVSELQKMVCNEMTMFEEQTFLEWSRSKKFPESVKWHPLEQAHKEAGNLIIQDYQEKTKSNNIISVKVG
jgi:hypothetical protein